MEQELKTFVKVWVSAIISVSYCYYIPPKIKSKVLRLLSITPICVMFFVLPLFFSNIHLTHSTFAFLTCLANTKLILLAFDQGPLFPLPSNLIKFICFTCLPVKLQQNPKSHQRQSKLFRWVVFSIKVVIFCVLLKLDCYKQNLHPILLLGYRPLYIYLNLEIIFALIKFVVIITLGCDLEPHFNEPYLATSLQDFWGRRWNLMVSSNLRSVVYTPVRRACKRLMSSDHALLVGFLAAFTVSGLFHELLYLYITREMPSWEATLFFVVNGVCTVVEVAVKRTEFGRRWKLNPVVSWLLTMGFLTLTGGFLVSHDGGFAVTKIMH